MGEELLDISGDGGVLKSILQRGHSKEHPRVGDEVEIHYTGFFQENKVQFDSSRDKGSSFRFVLGESQVIRVFHSIYSMLASELILQGWEIGIATLSKGDRCILVCRSDYAYGDHGHGLIPPNATLQFDIELINIRPTHHPTKSMVTHYFPIFFKDYARQYGDKYFSVFIRSASIIEKTSDQCWMCSQKIVLYNIEVIRGRRVWTVQRRYRELLDFYRKTECSHLDFPKKTYFPQYGTPFLQERIWILNSFLDSYLQRETSEGRLQTNSLVAEFFELNLPR